jgi:hypothetical protein
MSNGPHVSATALLLSLVAILSGSHVCSTVTYAAQQSPASTPRAEAPRDITGYWVSVITEDWRSRMLTPRKGDYERVPVNAEGRRVADGWDPRKKVPAQDACKPFGAPAIMRVPGRVRISWEDDATLKMETDAGVQTRRFIFNRLAARGWRVINARGAIEWFERGQDVPPTPGPTTWQGYSVARWDMALDPELVRPVALFPGGLGTGPDGAGKILPGRFGSLHVATTRLRSGYLRRNGVPYSDATRLTEDYDFRTEDDGTEWFTVTTVVEDPKYLSAPFVTTTDFRKEPDGSRWRPIPCSEY